MGTLRVRLLIIPLIAVSLVGCVARTAPIAQSSTPSANADSSSASPTGSETSCEDLLDAATVTAGKADKGTITKFAAADIDDGGTLKKFVEYGGIACSFGQDNADNPLLYGYGPITNSQAKKEMTHLKKVNKVSGTNEHGGTYFGAAGSQEIIVFSPKGYWAYQYNAGFGTQFDDDAIEQIVANAPAFY